MANTFAPNGFAQYSGAGSAPTYEQTVASIASSNSTPIFVNEASPLETYARAIPGFILSVVGVFTGWLAWWGAVEPLPPRAAQAVEKQVEQEVAVACAICGQAVAANVQQVCVHACGRVFHAGCYRAKASTYRGDASKCAICNVRVA